MPERRRRSRSRRRDRRAGAATLESVRSCSRSPDRGAGSYQVELAADKRGDAFPMYQLPADESAESARLVAHVCARPEEGYVIRVRNNSARHIACAVTVDGENALLRDGSLIVAPRDQRELPGFLVSKNFIGKEYVKEYRDFVFGKPKVVEGNAAGGDGNESYTTYGRICCEVYEAVLDEEVDSDQELRGQTTFFRGAGINGSHDERRVPEGKKKHFIYSSVTVQGSRSSISNSTRGRWWVRGHRKITTVEVRYREAHALMLLGVEPSALGLASCKREAKKEECKDEKEELDDEEKCGKPRLQDMDLQGLVQTCDLTADNDSQDNTNGIGIWTVAERPAIAEPVAIAEG